MEMITDINTLSITVLTFAAVVLMGGALISAGSAKRSALESRLQDDEAALRSAKDRRKSRAVRFFSKLGQSFSPKGISDDLSTKMAKAGLHSIHAPAVFMGTKVVLFIVAAVGGIIVAGLVEGPLVQRIFAVTAASTVAFFMPNYYIDLRFKQRSAEIRRNLPNAIDLLEICVSGGMGMDMAWNAVTDQMRPVCTILADEMALTNLEKNLGADRGTAMRHMAERCGADELNSLVAVLVQSERFGTAIAEALRIFTTDMREMRSQKAEENAEEMSVKMIFPMVTLIFPVVLIIAVGPAGIVLTELLGS